MARTDVNERTDNATCAEEDQGLGHKPDGAGVLAVKDAATCYSWEKCRKKYFGVTPRRGVTSIIIFVILWEMAARFKMPVLGMVPPPSAVIVSFADQIGQMYYWISWRNSMIRILAGFVVAQIIGVPLGLFLGINQTAKQIIYPIFEIMRPVPPLAWVPVSVIFWPWAEVSMIFVTFLGAFFTVVLNIVEGITSIDARYIRAAYSLGSTRQDVFWRILLPAALPSVVVGMTVGMGITWSVVVAAEMISSQPGLGYLTWRGYVAGEFPIIVVGMISIGLAGYISSAAIRLIGSWMTPWLRTN